ncbi:putative mediator of RNA polymerase II transcription subunit 8 [Procambarus clarkii]|uniref:putative mediator of RNA polymerase II transcription subunit 8 n=1 Tax=Procambarus clarkii TaxID=6728 RepID=UPI0037433FDA
MHTLALLTAVLSCGCITALGELHRVSHGGVVYAAAPQERGAYSVGAEGGRYNYGYNTGDGIAKVEVRQEDGATYGSYRYFDPNGKQVVRSYVADKRGFRVLGNDLPISPDTPASKVLGAPAFTGAVEGTAEFAIPPPLGSNAPPQTSSFQTQQFSQQQHLQDQLIQRQQETYRRQQQQVEEQRRQLRLQQEKLEALQRELEAQHLKIQQQLQQQQQIHFPQQPPVQQNYQFQASLQQQQQQSRFPQTQNQLTGGLTSPYYYFQQQLNYDFPAGFAYSGGMPVINTSPAGKTVYSKSPYVIG